MTNRTYKTWYQIHKWTSLICTLFLFLLCLTGLPLIFHHEIDSALGNAIDAPVMQDNTPAPLDQIAAAALQYRPNQVIQYIIWEVGEPNITQAVVAPAANTPPDDTETLHIDNRTAQVLGAPPFTGSVMFILLKLHTDLFLGLAGKLFLGSMGFLFVLATISGIVLYAPLMRKIKYGTIRNDKSRKIKWLDRHNLIGVSTMAWVLVVGGTGVVTSLADLAVQGWRNDELAAMIAPYQNSAPLSTLANVGHAQTIALAKTPDMQTSFVAYPGTTFSSPHHYTFFMRGNNVLTSYLWQPVLIDAQTADFTDMRQLPWYLKTILYAKPLHFGDYGGMPLKIIWGILDILALVILGSGLYLWWVKRT